MSALWQPLVRPRIVDRMDEGRDCAYCHLPIDVGEAWMRADREGAHIAAHAGCVYTEERRHPDETPAWEPQEGSQPG